MIIGISGKATAGKDTVCSILCELNNRDENPSFYPFETKRFADKLKDFVADIIGVERRLLEDQEFKKSLLGPEWYYKVIPIIGEETFGITKKAMSVRELLIRVGDGMRNVVHEDIWVNGLFASYNRNNNWIIPDMRYPNEKTRVEPCGYTIRINRPGIQEIDHISEKALDRATFHYTINNNSNVHALYESVKLVYDDIKRKSATVDRI